MCRCTPNVLLLQRLYSRNIACIILNRTFLILQKYFLARSVFILAIFNVDLQEIMAGSW